MTRLSERLVRLFPKPTRFLALVSLSTLHHLCKSLARFLLSQTLPATMDNNNLFSDYFSDDLDSSPYRPHRRDHDHDHYRDFAALERLYLLPYTWWLEEAQKNEEADHRGEAVLYTVSCNSDSEAEILLHLRKEEDPHNNNIGVSARQYALVPEGLWLRALKR